MKSIMTGLFGIFFSLSLVMPTSGIASNQDKKKQKDTAHENETTIKQDQTRKQTPMLINHMPIYKPPLRGAPAGRVAAGTRGVDQELPYLCLIVPDHIGLTLSSQPTLYFYQSKASSFPVEFTLIEKQGISPILEIQITPSQPSGIQAFRLVDYDVHLEPGVQYKWFIALIADPQRRSKDILAAGGIERIDAPENMKDKLANADISQAPFIYAEAGFWYDAFDTLSMLIEKSPDDPVFLKQRNALLEQIGLDQVTDHN